MPVTLVWRTDVHLSDDKPQSRLDDWATTVLRKLEAVGIIARRMGAQGVIDGGDFFNIKSPIRNSHALIQRVMAVHRVYPCPVWSCVGNHDCVYGDYSFLPQQPLGVLYEAGTFLRLYDEHEAVFTAPEILRMLPPTTVRVVGVPYHGVTYDLGRLRAIKKGGEDYLVVAAHLLASPTKSSMFESEDVIRYDVLDQFPDVDVWCFLPGTPVQTANGQFIPIEGIRMSDALAGRGSPVSVEEVHPARHVDEDVVTLTVEGLPEGIIPGVTREHPFWVAKSMGCRLPSRVLRRCHPDKPREAYPCLGCTQPAEVDPGWCPAGDIQAGDYVAIPVPGLPKDGIDAPGLARLLGLYLAEGHIVQNRSGLPVAGVGFSFHEAEDLLHQDVGRLVRDQFHLETHAHPAHGKCVQVCAYGSNVAEFFAAHGGRYSDAKVMGSWVWSLTPESRFEVLLGWLDGDGHARSPSQYRFKTEVMGATVSPQLASQLYLLALSVGLRPYYTIRPPGERVFPSGHTSQTLPCHCISFYGDDASLLARRMGVPIPDRSKTKVAGFFRDGMYWARVRAVGRKHYAGPVFNMRTSTQEYVAGFLLTHNCFGHWHKDQGIGHTPRGTPVVNVGSLTRGALSEDHTDRQPVAVVMKFDFNGVSFQRVPIPCAPSSEVFDLIGHDKDKLQQTMIEDFVDHLSQTLAPSAQKSLTDVVRDTPGIPDPVRERTIDYIEKAGGR
jgi:hypothetical protein